MQAARLRSHCTLWHDISEITRVDWSTARVQRLNSLRQAMLQLNTEMVTVSTANEQVIKEIPAALPTGDMKAEKADPVAACWGLCMPAFARSVGWDVLAAFDPKPPLLVADALLSRIASPSVSGCWCSDPLLDPSAREGLLSLSPAFAACSIACHEVARCFVTLWAEKASCMHNWHMKLPR